MISRRMAFLFAFLIFLVGILFGSYIKAGSGLITMNASVGLLDISLAIAAVLGPFLAVDRASSFVTRDVRTEIACIQQYKIIDAIDCAIRKIVHSTDGKSAINTDKEDFMKWIELASELEELADSPWLSHKSAEDLLSWTRNFKGSCSASIGDGVGNGGNNHTEIMKSVSSLSESRKKYFDAFVLDIKTTSI